MICEINHIWTAEMKWNWRNDRRSERNLCNCVKEPEKKFRTSTGFEHFTSWFTGAVLYIHFSFLHFHFIMLFVCHLKILHKRCFEFFVGVKMAPRETENNAYAKFWGDKQRALWYVMVFSGVVNFRPVWKFVCIGVPFSRNHLNRTKI